MRSRLSQSLPALLVRGCSAQAAPPAPAGSTAATSSTGSTAFKASVSFKVPDSKVTEENMPSVEDIERLIPTFEQLQKQLPSAKEMETKYIFNSVAAQQAAAEASVASGENKPLWPNCDTPEEIMDEERYGADGEVRPAPTSEQVQLAWRALAWGTLYALAGVAVASCVGLYACGFHSWTQLADHLRSREVREANKLREAAALQSSDGGEVQHLVLDLTNPLDLPRQIEEIYAAIQKLAEEEDEKRKTKSSALGASSTVIM